MYLKNSSLLYLFNKVLTPEDTVRYILVREVIWLIDKICMCIFFTSTTGKMICLWKGMKSLSWSYRKQINGRNFNYEGFI